MDKAAYLKEVLLNRPMKEQMLQEVQADPDLIAPLIAFSLTLTKDLGWRAAWVLRSFIKKNDARLLPHIDQALALLPQFNEGHQREWLRLLEKITLTEDQEGPIYDACLAIWAQVHKKPGVRIVALEYVASLVKKYPELMPEVRQFLQPEYQEGLSPGILKSYYKLVAGMPQG